MFVLYSDFTFHDYNVEFWEESDAEINEDIDNTDFRCMSPLNDSDNEKESSTADTERKLIVR